MRACVLCLVFSVQSTEPYDFSFDQLTEVALPPGLASLPPLAPDWRKGGEDRGRLGNEEYFLTRESEAFLEQEVEEYASYDEFTLEEFLAGVRSVYPRPVELSYRLEALDVDGARSVFSGKEMVTPGRVVVFSSLEERSILVDWDVEIAQAATIADPILQTQTLGTSLALQMEPLGTKSAYRVEVLVRHHTAQQNEDIQVSEGRYEGVRRNPAGFGELGTTFVLAPDGPEALTFPGPSGTSYRLTLAARGVPQFAADDQRAFYVPALMQPARGFRRSAPLSWQMGYPFGRTSEDSWIQRRQRRHDDLMEVLQWTVANDRLRSSAAVREAGPDVTWPEGRPWDVVGELQDEILVEGPTGFVFSSPEGASRLRDLLRRAVDDASKSHRVELLARVLLPDHEPREAKLSIPVYGELPSAFGGGTVRAILADWEVEVAQIAQVADPIFLFVEDGIRGDLRLVLDSARKPVGLELDVSLTSLEEIARELVPLEPGHSAASFLVSSGGTTFPPSAQYARSSSGAMEVHVPAREPQRGFVERPRIGTTRFQGSYALAVTDRERTLRLERSAVALYGPGARIELSVSVE